jgi:hypothetical protein
MIKQVQQIVFLRLKNIVLRKYRIISKIDMQQLHGITTEYYRK